MRRLTPIYKHDDKMALDKLSELKDEVVERIKKEVADELGGFPEMEVPDKFHDLVYARLQNDSEYNQIELELVRIQKLIIPISYTLK